MRQVGKTQPTAVETKAELPDLSDVLDMLEAPKDSMDVNPSAIEPQPGEVRVDDTSPWLQAFPDWDGPVMKLLDWRDTESRFQQKVAGAGLVEERRLTSMMRTLRERGEYRKLATVPRRWRSKLNTLERRFPNFAEVLDYLRVMFTLAEHDNRVPKLDPILLVGSPGCGKSYFAQTFGQEFGAGYYCLHMETAQGNAAFTGSADFWSNTKSGILFDALVGQDYANPIVHLDEIDKVTAQEYDPLGSLYHLLEPGTARHFSDLSYPWLNLDASAVIFICTANDTQALPEPILDRLREFTIKSPSPADCRRLVRQIFADLMSAMTNKAGEMSLPASSVELLVGQSPRQLRRVLREGIGRALYHRRRCVLPDDLPLERPQGSTERGIGFL